ncbi:MULTISPECIES: hypothetical protein [unclassified Acinetobacter]|uniref:hypothetical protein n=2 Tax=unclassified Acinetobacter TaxID=196816 RepID=UPI0015D425C1|nr:MULTISPECIES: hypothetical protein [unclassified Acinetobacter]
MKSITVNHPYRPDLYLFILHTVLMACSFYLWKVYPYIPNKPDMGALFFLIISVLGGFIGIVILAVTLPRLDRTVRYLTLSKFVLSLVYWLSSTTIFVLLGSTKFIFNNPLVLFVFVFLFFSSLYFSVIRVADMRKKDWLIIGGVLGGLVLLFFLPKL